MKLTEETYNKEQLKKEAHLLGEKLNRLIESSSINDKDVVTRYISLANRRLNEIAEQLHWTDVFGLAGMGMALKSNYQSKFGAFYCKDQQIKL